MYNYRFWLLDLDDTLQVGPLSWAVMKVLPEMALYLGYPIDPVRFEQGQVRAHELFEAGADDSPVAEALFRTLDWPLSLIPAMIERFRREYRPALFEDTVPFLERLSAVDRDLYILSNNNHARTVIESLSLGHYFKDILTPKACQVTGKPSTALWEYLKARTDANEANTVIVGDNLRTDGTFSETSGLNCIIVDRYNRYPDLPGVGRYQIIRSLDEILVTA